MIFAGSGPVDQSGRFLTGLGSTFVKRLLTFGLFLKRSIIVIAAVDII